MIPCGSLEDEDKHIGASMGGMFDGRADTARGSVETCGMMGCKFDGATPLQKARESLTSIFGYSRTHANACRRFNSSETSHIAWEDYFH